MWRDEQQSVNNKNSCYKNNKCRDTHIYNNQQSRSTICELTCRFDL